MSFVTTRRVLLLCSILLLSLVAMPSPATASTQTEAQHIISVAKSRLGDRYASGATGPGSFDCSGYVYWVYKQAGLLDRIGGARRTVAGYHNWFLNHGTVYRSLAYARPGDLLVWGDNHHTGIYLGNGYAISALINPWGVTIHHVGGISLRLTAVLHVRISR